MRASAGTSRVAPVLAVVARTDAGAIDALGEAWRALHAATRATPFQSWEWARAWWTHCPRGELLLLAAYAHDELVALLPLVLRRWGPLRRVMFLGAPEADYQDLLALPDHAAAARDAFAAWLAVRDGWDVIDLTDVPRASLLAGLVVPPPSSPPSPSPSLMPSPLPSLMPSPLPSLMPSASLPLPPLPRSSSLTPSLPLPPSLPPSLMPSPSPSLMPSPLPSLMPSPSPSLMLPPSLPLPPSPSWRVRVVAHRVCPYLALDGDWRAAAGKQLRARLKRQDKRLARDFAVTFDTAHGDELPHALDDLFWLHNRRWQRRGLRGAFARPAVRRFHHELARRFDARGWLRLHRLRADGKTRAAFYCFADAERVYYYLSGFDLGLARYSPGTLLMGRAVAAAQASGARVFDLLRGDENYKREWGARLDGTVRIIVSRRRSLRALVAVGLIAVERAAARAGSHLRNRLWGHRRGESGEASATATPSRSSGSPSRTPASAAPSAPCPSASIDSRFRRR
jgi:CelD/BcsL family acetyltransferase involved in cellulose biosynthesis